MTHTSKKNVLTSVPENSTHRASFGHLPGFLAVFVFMAVLLIGMLLLTKDYGGAAIISAAILLVWWRFRNMRLVFSDDSLMYQGWFKKYHFSYAEISRVLRPHDQGWPQDRMYAPSVYEIVTPNARAKINLLWFGPSADRAFKTCILIPVKQLRSIKRRK
ncbi:MAG: hypothetical protein JWO89_1179 [Verrucomicrobiaceae bacterium]|nr:hypothetical protein [Verrucomicrobiaceae bacterium]